MATAGLLGLGGGFCAKSLFPSTPSAMSLDRASLGPMSGRTGASRGGKVELVNPEAWLEAGLSLQTVGKDWTPQTRTGGENREIHRSQGCQPWCLSLQG